MPMYEYRCVTCGETYEELRKMEEADTDLECPHCGARDIRRLVSGFATRGGGCSPSPSGFS